MNEMRKLMETVSALSESTGPKAAFALYATDDGNGRFPGWAYVKHIVVIDDQGDYQANKKAALQTGIEQGLIDKNSIGFYTAYHIDDSEIDALRNVVAQLENV